jgi:DNA-binding response OmpR family regulator
MEDMQRPTNGRPKLVLLVDSDPSTRSILGSLLATSGLELVQARDSVTGLEIFQRLPDRFRLVIVSLEMPGLSGLVLIRTLRLFHPELPIVCLAGAEPSAAAREAGQCVAKPVRASALHAQLTDALAGGRLMTDLATLPGDAIARARACYASSGSLLEAAREIARAMPGETTEW